MGKRLEHATTKAIAAIAPRMAVVRVVVTVMAAPGVDAAAHATQSKANSSGCTACAKNRATAPTGDMSSARNRTGCASVMIGAATRLESGAIRLTRPNTQATSGAVTAQATIEVTSSLASLPFQPSTRSARWRRHSDPAATSAHMPSTLS